MTSFLLNLAALTVGGSVVILLLLALARWGRLRHGARWRCLLWLLLCLRMAIPVPIIPLVGGEEGRAPVQIQVPSDRPVWTGTDPAPAPPQDTADPVPSDEPHQTDPAPEQGSGESIVRSLSLFQLVFLLWLIGGVVVLIWSLFRHGQFLRYLRRWSSPETDPERLALYNALGDTLGLDRRPNLLLCQGLQVPMLSGIFRPVLLLPAEGLDEETFTYSVLHELTHYRRRDIWRKTLALWVCVLHWFNPFVWLMDRAISRDTELACDEDILRRLPKQDHAAYGRTILAAVERLKGANHEEK